MEKKVIGSIIAIIVTTAIFCGCIQGTEVEDESDVFFESTVTNLINYSLNFNEDHNGNIVKATVDGKIENKIDRQININITIEYYDVEDNYIGSGNYRIFGLRTKPKAGSSTTFTTEYAGKNVDKISYIKFYVDEIV